MNQTGIVWRCNDPADLREVFASHGKTAKHLCDIFDGCPAPLVSSFFKEAVPVMRIAAMARGALFTATDGGGAGGSRGTDMTVESLVSLVPRGWRRPMTGLRKHEPRSTQLTAVQCFALLSHAFFGMTEGDRETPGLDFSRFFAVRPWLRQEHSHKLLCLLHYFVITSRLISEAERITKQTLQVETQETKFCRRIIEFIRVTNGQPLPLELWAASQQPLALVEVKGPEARMEDAKLHCDFANRWIGGGVLSEGCAQEEIRLLISPEFLVVRLLATTLQDNEALILVGATRFTTHTGYGATFKCAGPASVSNGQWDAWDKSVSSGDRDWDMVSNPRYPGDPPCPKLCVELVAVDATPFGTFWRNRVPVEEQTHPWRMLREANKFHTGVAAIAAPTNLTLATGNWGCGAFGGDRELKFLLQWVAASQTGRGLSYHPIEWAFSTKLQRFLSTLASVSKALQVGTLWGVLLQLRHLQENEEASIFDFVTSALSVNTPGGQSGGAKRTSRIGEDDMGDVDMGPA